jgi:molybdopterin/thiamine biosynthesis adenylyltransferase
MENSAGRYHRQSILPQIGAEGQEKLSASSVLLVGCGALGTAMADLLVRAGVGSLRIVDRDLVELTNLQRQVLFDEEDARQETPKAVAAANRLSQINSSVKAEGMVSDFNASNAESLAAKVDLILDGTDNVSTRYLINDLAVKHQIPWIYGACVGVWGRVMGIVPGKSACLRCLYPAPPRPEELPTCDIAGVLGPAASIVASLQATLTIRMIVDPQFIPAGLLTLDVWQGEFRSLAPPGPQQDCPCCGSREFPFLSTTASEFTTTLCGRNAVQVMLPRGHRPLDLASAAGRLANVGIVERAQYFIRCRPTDAPAIALTLFPDGRLMVQGTTDAGRARSLYARYIGT